MRRIILKKWCDTTEQDPLAVLQQNDLKNFRKLRVVEEI